MWSSLGLKSLAVLAAPIGDRARRPDPARPRTRMRRVGAGSPAISAWCPTRRHNASRGWFSRARMTQSIHFRSEESLPILRQQESCGFEGAAQRRGCRCSASSTECDAPRFAALRRSLPALIRRSILEYSRSSFGGEEAARSWSRSARLLNRIGFVS